MKLMLILTGFLLIKAVLTILPSVIRNTMLHIIPRKQYTVEEVIRCGHMRPDLYYKKQLMEQEALPRKVSKRKSKLIQKEIVALKSKSTNTYKEVDIKVIRESFKKKMQNRELTRSQILAIKSYLMQLVNCKEKKFDNDCHCIYFCLKQLDKEQMLDLTALANLLK